MDSRTSVARGGTTVRRRRSLLLVSRAGGRGQGADGCGEGRGGGSIVHVSMVGLSKTCMVASGAADGGEVGGYITSSSRLRASTIQLVRRELRRWSRIGPRMGGRAGGGKAEHCALQVDFIAVALGDGRLLSFRPACRDLGFVADSPGREGVKLRSWSF